MSYILDALKKAERERDAAQIPTLTTVHDMPVSPSRKLYWIIFGISVVCVSLLAGTGWYFLKPLGESGPSKAGLVGVAAEADVAPVPNYKADVPPDPVSSRQPVEPKVQPTASSGKDLAQDVKPVPPLHQIQKEPASPSPKTKAPDRPQVPSETPPPETAGLTPSAPAAPSNPLPLNEAIAKMNITVLFYSETKSERMVFIDGRRYAEGDYVNGLYLIENITPEGAWLSYQGNRAILRPKAK
jgi:general secretion pathway protein B